MSDIYSAKTLPQLYSAMERYLIGQSSALTNFNNGSRTKTMLEAVSRVCSEAQANMWSALRDSIPVSAIEGFGFTRLGGTQATGTLKFTRTSPATTSYPVPAGTRVILGAVEYETTTSTTIAMGAMSTTSIAARATIVGSAGNIGALTIDTENGLGSLSSPPMGVAFAKNPSAFVGGTDEETDEQRMDRFRLYIEGLARCTVNGLISGAKSVTGVRSASVRENYPAPGWVSVYCDDGSGALPATTTLLVYKVLNGDTNDPTNYWGYRAAGIQVQVLAPTVVPVSLTIILYAPTLAVSIDAELQAVATTAVTQYIDSLYMGNDVVIAEVIASVQNASDDIYDCSIVSTNPAAGSGRITITAQQVAKTQTVAITVTRGSFPS